MPEQPEPIDGSADGPVGGSSVAPARRPRTRLLLTLAVLVLLADLVTKLIVVVTITPGENIRLLGGLLYLTYYRNSGAAFSFAEGFTDRLHRDRGGRCRDHRAHRTAAVLHRLGVSLGLVLGGAVGNLFDRVFRDPGFLRGEVVDFLSVLGPDGRVWPIFNVADSAIVCGGILGALLALRGIDFDGSRAGSERAAPAPSRGSPRARER